MSKASRMSAEDVYAILNKRIAEGGGGSGTGGGSYNSLTNKPSINGVTLTGQLSLEQLGIEEISNLQIEEIINSIGGL